MSSWLGELTDNEWQERVCTGCYNFFFSNDQLAINAWLPGKSIDSVTITRSFTECARFGRCASDIDFHRIFNFRPYFERVRQKSPPNSNRFLARAPDASNDSHFSNRALSPPPGHLLNDSRGIRWSTPSASTRRLFAFLCPQNIIRRMKTSTNGWMRDWRARKTRKDLKEDERVVYFFSHSRLRWMTPLLVNIVNLAGFESSSVFADWCDAKRKCSRLRERDCKIFWWISCRFFMPFELRLLLIAGDLFACLIEM